MRISTKRILSIGLSIILVIGTIAVYVNLVSPELTVINNKRGEVASKQNLYNNQSLAVAKVQDLIGQFQNLARVTETVSLAMPIGPATIGGLRQIEAIAKVGQVNLAYLNFSFPAVKPAPDVLLKQMKILKVGIGAQGDYPTLKEFLKLLETSIRVINVTNLKFEPAGVKGIVDSLSLEAEMYFQQ